MRGLNRYTSPTSNGLVLPSYYGIVSTGQSLSTGDFGTPPISTSVSGGNKQVHDSSGTYDVTLPNAGTLSLIDLVAPVRADKYAGGGGDVSPYPVNIGGEDPSVAMANTLASLLGTHFVPAVVGQGGAAMSVIKKGGSGNAYAAGLYEMRVVNRLGANGCHVSAVVLTHGEADAAVAVATYQAQIASMQSDYQTDLLAITGQAGSIPLIVSQQNAFPSIGGGVNNSAQAQALAVLAAPSLILGGPPKYQYPYQGDRAHLTAAGYRLLGEKYAQALYRYLTLGSWMPLIATGAVRASNVVTVTFHVPFGPMQFDGVSSPPHQSGTYSLWNAGKGFELWTGGYGGTPVGISSVAIVGSTVVITGAGACDTVAYAMTPDNATGGTFTGGFPDGRCGLLEDSDTFAGLSGTVQTNRAWAFVTGGL